MSARLRGQLAGALVLAGILALVAGSLAALASAGVNIGMISTSEIRISVVVSEGDVDEAVRATHSAFELDSDEVEAVVYGGTGR